MQSFFLMCFTCKLAFWGGKGHGNVTRKVDITALWKWITRRKMKRSQRKRALSPTRSLSTHVDLGGEKKYRRSLGGVGWLAQFADKLPFREAWEDLRAFSARLWVGVFPVWWCSSALRISFSLVSDSSHLFLSRSSLGSLTRGCTALKSVWMWRVSVQNRIFTT